MISYAQRMEIQLFCFGFPVESFSFLLITNFSPRLNLTLRLITSARILFMVLISFSFNCKVFLVGRTNGRVIDTF